MRYLIKRKTWNKKVRRRLKYQEERKKQLGINLLKLVEGVLILAVLSFIGTKIYHFMLNAPYFAVKNIKIEGVKALSKEEVSNFSKAYQEDNIFRVSLSDLENNIKSLPAVKNVRISRILPDTILVKVTERMPIGLINRDGVLYCLDEEGNVFKLASRDTGIRLPFIAGFESDVLNGKIKNIPRINLISSLMKELLSIELPVAGQLLAVDIQDPDNIVLQTRNYGRIALGTANFDELRKRLIKLTRILEDIKQRPIGIEYIDMRFKNIVVKPILVR
jgi:cell division protein FtsQ